MQGSMPTARSRTSTPRCRGPAAKRSEKQSRRKASCSPRLPRVGFLLRRSRSTSSPTSGWRSPATRSPLGTRPRSSSIATCAPALGKKRIEKIGPVRSQPSLPRRSKPVARTARRSRRPPSCASTASSALCLELAVTNDWITTNPAARARPPRQVEKVPESPGVESVKAMLSAAYKMDKEMYAFLRLASATGLRRGSICGLRWSDLDLARGTLLHQRAIGMGKGAPYEKTTKSGASHTIALDRDTVTILRWHRLRMLMRSKDLGGLDPTGYLFSADPTCSKPWRPDHASKRFASVRESAGVTGQLRDLRNFHATVLLDDGFDIKTVSGRLTHARTSTTQDRYQARLPATDRRARGARRREAAPSLALSVQELFERGT